MAIGGVIAATDFFTIEAVTWGGLPRYFVLFAIDLKTRQVETRTPRHPIGSGA
jgi:hypothetical protein